MLEIYLIRHAKSEANENVHLITGRSDHSPLSENGKRQAHLLGQRFKAEGITFDKVYASTAVRTADTGVIVGEYLGFGLEDIAQHEELLELSMGDWVGRKREEVYTPEILEHINSNNWLFRPPNGETQKEVEERMYAWVETYLLVNEDLRVVVFSHGMAIRCLLRKIMEFTPAITYRIGMENTAITHLSYKEKEKINGEKAKIWIPNCINDHAHLTLIK